MSPVNLAPKLRLRDFASRLILVCACVATATALAFGQASPEKKVLVLYWDNKDVPANVSFDDGFREGMLAEPNSAWQLFNEYLDSARFPAEQQTRLLYEYLKQKYANVNIDAVVASPDPSLDFLLKHRGDLFSSSPIVFVGVKRPSPDVLSSGAGVTGILQASTYRITLDLALQLHPDTQNLFVISGTPEGDKRFET